MPADSMPRRRHSRPQPSRGAPIRRADRGVSSLSRPMNTSWTHNSRRALRPLLLLLGVAAAVISGLILIAARGQAASQSGGSTQLINGIACERDERLALHIHAHVAIYANGELQTVPYGIGIGKPWQVLQSTQG